jgi:hypothetical protein
MGERALKMVDENVTEGASCRTDHSMTRPKAGSSA